jgi:hypothetical protein
MCNIDKNFKNIILYCSLKYFFISSHSYFNISGKKSQRRRDRQYHTEETASLVEIMDKKIIKKLI